MAHESRLNQALRELLQTQRVAALATLTEAGTPFVSMVPYAIQPSEACLVIHVSALAAHTRQLRANPVVSLLVMQPEQPGAAVHALPRATLQGHATLLQAGDQRLPSARDVYLARFPEAEPMTQLGDFSFVAIRLDGCRHVAGFGAARSLDADAVSQLLSR